MLVKSVKCFFLFFLFVVNMQVKSQTITYIYPTNGSQGYTISINIIASSNAHFTQGPTPVVWLSYGTSTIYADSVDINSNINIVSHLTIPMFATIGYWGLNVQDSIDGTITKPNSFYINLNPYIPQIQSVNPSIANQGQSMQVNINGQNTHFTLGGGSTIWLSKGANTINSVSSVAPNDYTIVSQFSIPTNAVSGSWDVNVQNSIDGLITKSNGFYINSTTNPPQIISIVPDSVEQGQSLTLTINGTNTNFTATGGTTVWFKHDTTQMNPLTTTVINDSTININLCVPSSATLGYWNIHAFNVTDSLLIKYNGLYIKNPNIPLIISLDPDSAEQGQSLVVMLSTNYTHFTSGLTPDVWLRNGSSSIYYDSINILSDSLLKLYFNIPIGTTLGFWDVQIQHSIDGQLELLNGFKILQQSGIHQFENDEYSCIYPNPVDDILNIELLFDKPSEIRISIINILGEEIFSFKDRTDKTYRKFVDLKYLSKGIYFVIIKSNDAIIKRKIVKK